MRTMLTALTIRPESTLQDGSSQIERPQGIQPWNVAIPSALQTSTTTADQSNKYASSTAGATTNTTGMPFDREAFDSLVDVSSLFFLISALAACLIRLVFVQDFAEKYAQNLTTKDLRDDAAEHARLLVLLRAAARLLADDASSVRGLTPTSRNG